MLHTTPPIHIHQFHLYPDHGSEHSLPLDQNISDSHCAPCARTARCLSIFRTLFARIRTLPQEPSTSSSSTSPRSRIFGLTGACINFPQTFARVLLFHHVRCTTIDRTATTILRYITQRILCSLELSSSRHGADLQRPVRRRTGSIAGARLFHRFHVKQLTLGFHHKLPVLMSHIFYSRRE